MEQEVENWFWNKKQNLTNKQTQIYKGTWRETWRGNLQGNLEGKSSTYSPLTQPLQPVNHSPNLSFSHKVFTQHFHTCQALLSHFAYFFNWTHLIGPYYTNYSTLYSINIILYYTIPFHTILLYTIIYYIILHCTLL